jgi:signal transduction histidine kinase
MMHTLDATVLLISHDEALCSAVRSALARSEPSCHIAAVPSFAAARNAVAELSPDVIVLQESSLLPPSDVLSASRPVLLADIVSALAGFAPVVVVGEDQPPANLSVLLASGAADFVTADELHFSDAAACVEKHLYSARRRRPGPNQPDLAAFRYALASEENFGELLRHELNNPLTGILGNAELLLAEMRRQSTVPLSQPGVKRLETIATLAVRMRETVRRLSQAFESRGAGSDPALQESALHKFSP